MDASLSYPEHFALIPFLSRAASLFTTMATDTPEMDKMVVKTPKVWNMLKSMVIRGYW